MSRAAGFTPGGVQTTKEDAMRALTIDDSRAMRAILKGVIKGMGFDCIEATNGQEGLDRVKTQGPFDLILVDWNMPVMNGLEFVQAAKPLVAATAKIVMVTTEVEMTQVAKALEAGADEYVMKPFTPEILRDKLSMLGLVAA